MHYNKGSSDCFSSLDAMSSNLPNLTRPSLTLDEQSFQELLSAAFTIQEHNERGKQAQPTTAEEVAVHLKAAEPEACPETCAEPDLPSVCPHCGAPKSKETSRCGSCGLAELRPGERLQRNWASMWLMSQEQGLWPERSSEASEATKKIGEDPHPDLPPIPSKWTSRGTTESALAASNFLALPMAKKEVEPTTTSESRDMIPDRVIHGFELSEPGFGNSTEKDRWTADAREIEHGGGQWFGKTSDVDADLDIPPFELSSEAGADPLETAADGMNSESDATPSSLLGRWADIQVTLRFHRADLYLGVAVFVAMFALLWPAASAPKRAALGPWEKALVTMGIAEAPAPAIHAQGDPSIEVWVDPHTALYYCPGAEAFGKTPNGRFSSQGDAQLDRFEPAERSVCE